MGERTETREYPRLVDPGLDKYDVVGILKVTFMNDSYLQYTVMAMTRMMVVTMPSMMAINTVLKPWKSRLISSSSRQEGLTNTR